MPGIIRIPGVIRGICGSYDVRLIEQILYGQSIKTFEETARKHIHIWAAMIMNAGGPISSNGIDTSVWG